MSPVAPPAQVARSTLEMTGGCFSTFRVSGEGHTFDLRSWCARAGAKNEAVTPSVAPCRPTAVRLPVEAALSTSVRSDDAHRSVMLAQKGNQQTA